MSQIADLADLVGQELAVRRYPYRVAYGPERTQRTGPGVAGGVVFERDRARGDTIDAPLATHPLATSPGTYLTRRIAGAVTVYAASPLPGARVQDHEREADAVCDGVVSAMHRICRFAGKPIVFGRSSLLQAAAFGGLEVWPGAAVRVEFTLVVPVSDLDYLGHGPGTGVVAHVANTVTTKLVAEPDDP